MDRNEKNLESVDRMTMLAEEVALDIRSGAIEVKEAAEINNSIGKHAKEVAISIAIQCLQKDLVLTGGKILRPQLPPGNSGGK